MAPIFVFVSGAALLIFSADRLVNYLVGAASRLLVPVFLLAVIFTGIEFDDVALGVALNLEDLQGVALGLVYGTAVSFSGIILALAVIIKPTKVTVAREYLLIFAAAPVMMIVFTLTSPIGDVDSVVLLALFVVFIGYIAARERRRTTPTFQNTEVYEELIRADAGAIRGGGDAEDMPFAEVRRFPGWANLGLAVLALAGLIVGAQTTSIGTEGILETYGIDGTVFGATITTIVLAIEDIVLTVQPFRKGVPAIGIGNVIGSLVFSVTGKLGIIVIAGGSIVVGSGVVALHLPALILVTGTAAYFLSTGSLRRWHGYVLLALYVLYWVVSFVGFQTIPVED